MSETKPRFDGQGFFQALEMTVKMRDMKWKDVSEKTGISASTLSRMSQGRGPDSASLATLAAWSGLNPGDFVSGAAQTERGEVLPRVALLLRNDRRLKPDAADILEKMMAAAYEKLADKG